MALLPGTSLGTYRILDLIGKGGMGEVYRAQDITLKRNVAVKVLPGSFVGDPHRLARFQRESELLASLNNPNIAAIYGVQESGDTHALVMELVEGEMLSGPLPVETALRYAKQLAEGLEYAHEKGIIHRDLKPANIKISPEGVVKVLDFGLAKAIESPSEEARTDLSASPTLTLGVTVAGVVLGTAAYMSPEQVAGKTLDRRSDVWSFGAVLYEMLTGKQAFAGESSSDILATVLKVDPDWDALPANTPASIRRLIQRCLKKDRKQRLQAIGDARIAIEEALAEPHDVTSAATLPPRSRFGITGWIVAVALFAALLFLVVLRPNQQSSETLSAVRLTLTFPERVNFGNVLAVSPDGQRVLYIAAGPDGMRRIYVRALAAFDERVLMGTEGVQGVPFWSANSRMIVFGDGAKLKKIAASGGPAEPLCDAAGLIGGGFWTAEDVIVFSRTSVGNIYRIPAAGGTPSPLTQAKAGVELFHAHPFPLPDGKRFLYTRSTIGDEGGIFIGSIAAKPEEQPSTRVLADQASPVYVAPSTGLPGYLLFRRDGTLLAQPFDAEKLTVSGEPVVIAEQVLAAGRFGVFSASTNGVLAYRTGVTNGRLLTTFSREGRPMDPLFSDSLYDHIAVSRDGSRAAVSIQGDAANPATYDIWLIDLLRKTKTKFTSDPTADYFPVWSPDGAAIVFGARSSGPVNLFLKTSNGTGIETPLLKSPVSKSPSDWSSDGRYLVYSSNDPKTKQDLWLLTMVGEHTPSLFLQTANNEYQGQFSPNGKWMAYVSDESGTSEVYVLPFPRPVDGGTRWMVSSGGGVQPRWSPDGKTLFYLARGGSTMMEAVVASEAPFKTAMPKALMDIIPFVGSVGDGAPPFRWGLADNGKRFIMTTVASTTSDNSIKVVLNWQADLKKKQ